MTRRVAATLVGTATAALALIGGIAYATTATASAPHSTTHVVSTVSKAAAGQKAASETPGESGTESSAELPGDGQGGHADPAGTNADHQFNGQE
jgi:uncharacterized low-complexity protein